VIVTYTPSDSTVREFQFVPQEIDVDTAELVEVHAGQSFQEFVNAAMEGRARALRVCLWLMLRQDLPTLKFADTPKFRMGEVKIDLGRSELLELKKNLNKVPEAKREAVAKFVEDGLKEFEGQSDPKAE